MLEAYRVAVQLSLINAVSQALKMGEFAELDIADVFDDYFLQEGVDQTPAALQATEFQLTSTA
jgi:hypothetical protein